MPAQVTRGAGEFRLSPALTVKLEGPGSPMLTAAVRRMLLRVSDKTGVRHPRELAAAESGADLTIKIASSGAVVPQFGEDESYQLQVTSSAIRLEAQTPHGALHGLESLYQLVQPSGSGYAIAAVTLTDAPRFPWRGLMIDCVRHFEPLDLLKRNLDAMAAVKLNVFHWHLTDDQGFRMESRKFPRLTLAGSDGQFYTQEDARELIRYAQARGIRVVPEFEMPGHSTAWLVAYPELASGSSPTAIRQQFGISDYALDPTREETYSFLSSFLAEMAGIFPDRYVHIGGDETPAPDWKINRNILNFMQAHQLKDNDALQAYFNQRVQKILAGLDKRMVGWDEVLHPDLPHEVVIQSWRGEASVAKATAGGYAAVLSAPYYLDAMKPASVHYLADPVPAGTTMTVAQQKLVLGGEICMWAEHLDQHTVESRLWPRTAAIAERFWSPQSLRNVDDLYRRLPFVSLELEQLGLQHRASEDKGLRDLAGSAEIDALRVFAKAFQPVSFSTRYQQQKTDGVTPLTSFVDAVVPDPEIRSQLEVAVRVFLRAPRAQSPEVETARSLLVGYFAGLRASLPAVQSQIAISPRLMPMQVRAAQLEALAQAGEEAMEWLSSGKPAPPGWKSAISAELEEAKKPSGLVDFVFLPELAKLVQAVQEQS